MNDLEHYVVALAPNINSIIEHIYQVAIPRNVGKVLGVPGLTQEQFLIFGVVKKVEEAGHNMAAYHSTDGEYLYWTFATVAEAAKAMKKVKQWV